MSKAEYNNFGQKLAFHSAPTLFGIKCANIIQKAVKKCSCCLSGCTCHGEMKK